MYSESGIWPKAYSISLILESVHVFPRAFGSLLKLDIVLTNRLACCTSASMLVIIAKEFERDPSISFLLLDFGFCVRPDVTCNWVLVPKDHYDVCVIHNPQCLLGHIPIVKAIILDLVHPNCYSVVKAIRDVVAWRASIASCPYFTFL